MKKAIALAVAAFMLLLSAAGCAATSESATSSAPAAKSAAGTASSEAPAAMSGEINVVSREDGSGTRGAFIELFGVEEKDADGNKIDNTADSAEITNSTSVMMTTVAGDPSAIGYISLGSLNDTVKALSIDGAMPSVAAIKDGAYTISRPFNIATKGELSATAQDFLNFILSADGQDVVEQNGYIRIEDTGAFQGASPSGKVVVAGSSSVTPVMEALAEAYKAINSGADIEVQQSDSTTGMNSAIEGICDIGMASRELKDSELEQGLTATKIAIDGIAVIVNSENPTANLTKDQVKSIYTGAVTDWSELG